MTSSFKQSGASTSGLLTASAIYIGLLVYAGYFAFDQTQPSVTMSENTIQMQGANQALIQPSAAGIFQSETLKHDETHLNIAKQSQSVTHPTETESSKSARPAGSDYRISSALYYPQASQHRVPYDQALSHQYYSVHPYSTSSLDQDYRSYGQGKGRGKARSSGNAEMNFSMSFKSRARMNADVDGDFDADGYHAANARYINDSAMHPSYNGYYNRY